MRMTILELIDEWRQGCRFATNPLECTACTEKLINNIENIERVQVFGGCITPKFYLVVDRLRDAACLHPEDDRQRGLGEMRLVERSDLAALMHEFFRLDAMLRKQNPHIYVEPIEEEEHRVC